MNVRELKKAGLVVWVVFGAVFFAGANDEVVLAGWDRAVDTKKTDRAVADLMAAGIDATLVLSTTVNQADGQGDWTTAVTGSNDETFGTFPGAAPNMKMSAYLSRVDGVYIDYTVMNKGTVAYELKAFRFDIYKKWSGSGIPSLRIMDGGGITAGSLMVGSVPDFNANPAKSGEDYTDLDISLSELADHTLAVGEQVTFRILINNNGGTFVDNVALTAIPVQ